MMSSDATRPSNYDVSNDNYGNPRHEGSSIFPDLPHIPPKKNAEAEPLDEPCDKSSDKPSNEPSNESFEEPFDKPLVESAPEWHYHSNDSIEESSVFSGVSSSSRAAHQTIRKFPLGHTSFESQSSDPDSGYPNFFSFSRPDPASTISEQWAHLCDQKRRMARGRKTMLQLLSDIQKLRVQKTHANESFCRMRRFSEEASKPLPLNRSARLLDKMQEFQDDITSVESQLGKLEADMARHEDKFERSEKTFCNSLSTAMDLQPQEPFITAVQLVASGGNDNRQTQPNRALTVTSRSLPDSLLGIFGERPNDEHPLSKLLTQTIKDLEAARNRYAELSNLCHDIKQDQRDLFKRRRMRSNNPCAYDLDKLNDALAEVDGYHSNLSQSAYFGCFDKVDQEFLLHYGDTIASAAAVIRTKEEHVARLRKTCRQMSILPEDNPKEDDDTGEDYELQQDDLDIFSAKASSFPILLSNPLYAVKQYPLTIRAAAQKMLALPKNEPERQALIDDSVKEYGILISLMRSAEGSKSDFINRWILQQLRMSPMAAVQFYSIFSGVLPIVDVIRWQQDVLCFWTRDGTNEPDGPITGHSSSCSGVFALSVVSENDDEG